MPSHRMNFRTMPWRRNEYAVLDSSSPEHSRSPAEAIASINGFILTVTVSTEPAYAVGTSTVELDELEWVAFRKWHADPGTISTPDRDSSHQWCYYDDARSLSPDRERNRWLPERSQDSPSPAARATRCSPTTSASPSTSMKRSGALPPAPSGVGSGIRPEPLSISNTIRRPCD